VRWVDASSERIWAREEGGAASVEPEDAFPLGVLGRMTLVPAVGVGAVSSSTAASGWFASVAVRSASLVSSYGQYCYEETLLRRRMYLFRASHGTYRR
jgi:hypothetical protein